MKIAIFSDNFYPEISGISDSIILLGQELAKLGHEIHFFGASYSKRDHAKANLPYAEPQLGENIKFHRFWSLPMLGSPTGQSRIVIPFGVRCLKFRKEKFDVIYTQSPYGLGVEALFMSWMFGIPLVGTNHTPITEFTRYLPLSNRFFDWLGLKFVSWYYNRCQFISTPFAGIAAEMKTYGLKKQALPLSNPLDLQNFVPVSGQEKLALKEKYQLSGQTVLYTGRLAPEKQVDVIIKAMLKVRKAVPDAMLAITGIGNAESDLKKLTAKLGLVNAVKFFGRVDDQTHAELYQASDVFAVMSTAETQCLSMMKAMSTGMPVIGADAWALPDYIGRDEQRGYVVPVADAHALAEKIIFLLQNPKEAQEMGQRGIEFVQQYNSDAIALKWQEIFANACQRTDKE